MMMTCRDLYGFLDDFLKVRRGRNRGEGAIGDTANGSSDEVLSDANDLSDSIESEGPSPARDATVAEAAVAEPEVAVPAVAAPVVAAPVVAAPVVAAPAMPQPVATARPIVVPTPVPAPAHAAPTKAEPYALPIDDLNAVASAAGLEWVHSDSDKVRAAQAAMAAEVKPPRVPRQPKPPVAIDDGPLILVETKKDLSQIKLPFDR